jgi:hypothetical protein
VTEILFLKTGQGLIPADEYQAELMPRWALGDIIKGKFTKPRNGKFHRKYFAMLAATFDMQDSYDNTEHWRDAVLIAAGHCETFINHLGEVNYKPKSIAFANCEEHEFNRVYNQSIQAICDHWVNGEPEQIRLILEYA